MKKTLIALSIIFSSTLFASDLDNLAINKAIFDDLDVAREYISKECHSFKEQRAKNDFYFEILDMDKVGSGVKIKWFCRVF